MGGGTRVAVGGETGVLLVAHEYVPQPRELHAAVQLEVVYAGNAEHGVDAVGGEGFDDVPSDRPGRRAHVLEMLTPATHSKYVQFSPLVHRIGGDGADAWLTHYEAVAARERGEDVIILSVGDPDLDTPAPVIERAIERLRAGDTHYVVAAGRPALRAAIARAHADRSGQAVGAENVVCFAGAQNALFVASMCLAGPGDEVITFEPLYPTYPATIEVSGARLVRAPATAACRPDLRALTALITPRTRAISGPRRTIPAASSSASRSSTPSPRSYSGTGCGWSPMRCTRGSRRRAACRPSRRACPSRW